MVLGFLGAAVKMLAEAMSEMRRQMEHPAPHGAPVPDPVAPLTDFVKAFTGLIAELGKAPMWLGCVGVGALLELAGIWVIKSA